jgi:predicted transposase/invertase (TIGR01784 family)
MPLGIRPTVDFAFKKIFGSPQNSDALLGLLNAILDLPNRVESVEVLNPFSYQEFAENKLIVLDVRCRDSVGRWLNVEMQVSAYAGLIERLVYYACSMYVDQLAAGANYALAAPAISICLLSHRLFPESDQAHHRFAMVDEPSGRRINNAVEVHTVELTKYNLDSGVISQAGELEQWAFLLLHAQDYEAAHLKQLLPGIAFEAAIDTIEVISAKTEDKSMYDQREKAQRDYEWAISGARQEGRQEGERLGLEKGREEGKRLGREKGELIGKIQLCQELLGASASTSEELSKLDTDALTMLVGDLQKRLRQRPS